MTPPSLKYSTNMYVNDVKNDTLHNKNKIKLSLSMNVHVQCTFGRVDLPSFLEFHISTHWQGLLGQYKIL